MREKCIGIRDWIDEMDSIVIDFCFTKRSERRVANVFLRGGKQKIHLT
jgi:hypothetical protein